MNRLEEFITECRNAATAFLALARKENPPVTVVHHNDADGVAAAAVLARTFEVIGMQYRLLPLEKIHETIVEKIHETAAGTVFYADLGGQSSHLIGRYAGEVRQVIILDHHLPGGPVPGNVIHCNCERYGISGDDEASGASVCALFARELLGEAGPGERKENAWLAAMGVVGAVGDGQDRKGILTGLNGLFLEEAVGAGVLEPWEAGYRIPALHQMTLGEVAEILTLLGSVGFYSGSTERGVALLLGRDHGEAFRLSVRLREMKASLFRKEAVRIRRQGLQESGRFEWVDVKDRFAPMGVKTIGLFLEYLIEQNLTSPDKYLMGFQHLPSEMPGIGRLDKALTKISARVHPALKTTIQEGTGPDFMTLIPEATDRVAGVADGCHLEEALADAGRGRKSGKGDR